MASKRLIAFPIAVAVTYVTVSVWPSADSTRLPDGVSSAKAYSSYLMAFKNRYPTTTLDTRLSCTLCHTPQGYSAAVNCYKRDLAALGTGISIDTRINMLDGVDSDGDGATNGAEAVAARPGGGVGFSPGLVGSTGTDPCGSNTSTPVTSVCETSTDSDGDGTINCNDGCPNDAAKTSAGTCGCGVADTDSDGDGVADCLDQCPGVSDTADGNSNGLPDCLESASFTVNTVADTVDINPGDGICADSGGHCSLRAAVMESNANIDSNTIILPAGTYVLTIPGADLGDLSGDLNILENVSIQGAGAATTIIDGNGADCVFDLGSYQSIVSISNVTVQNGYSTSFGSGGIYSLDNTLTLTNVAIINNTLSHASSYGGGLFSGGPLTMTNCLVANNTLTASATGIGGGICLYFGGTSTLTNCTISGNSASGGMSTGGGGIAIQGNNTTLRNCTITNNTCLGSSGGIYFDSNTTSTLTIENTIVHANIGTVNCEASTFTGSVITSAGHNLENTDTCNFHATGDLINTTPNLGPLANNGGPTKTHALLVGSPAIDAGAAVSGVSTDQRGVTCPTDGNHDGTAIADIGAFEFADCNNDGTDDASQAASGTTLPDCDNDGIPDACELTADCDQNGVPDSCESDADGDGVIDACDNCPNNSNNADSDADGTPDCNDGCPDDAGKTEPGDCGCGSADTDSDGDGIADCVDVCPDDSNPLQEDADNDGRGDVCDSAPNDASVGGAADETNDESGGSDESGSGDDNGTGGSGDASGAATSSCGSGVACGANAVNMLMLTLAGLLCMKARRRF